MQLIVSSANGKSSEELSQDEDSVNKSDEEAIQGLGEGEIQESVGDDVQKSIDGDVYKAAKQVRAEDEAVTLSLVDTF